MAKGLAWRKDSSGFCDHFAQVGNESDEYQLVVADDGSATATFSPTHGASITIGEYENLEAAQAACAKHFRNLR
jgi:hypothetical protein